MSEFIDQPWVKTVSLQTLLSILSAEGGVARVAGGAVRNALLNETINDIDVATTLVPRDVILRLNSAGHKTVPTGIEHGTVTAIIDGDAYEVTTLRQDIETDGRHAKVLYGTDWVADARRRDLTMNALYMNADGSIYDPLDGMADVLSHTVRFIDDAETRIREDYLRILRFFRFFAWYGKFRPDASGLRACTRLKDGIETLSSERIWHEVMRLLAAPDPSRTLLWMRQTGVLGVTIPETIKWGIDVIPGLMKAEKDHNWSPDPVQRLMAVVPPQSEKIAALATRFKVPNKVRDRLQSWVDTPESDASLKKEPFYRWLYWQDQTAVTDRLQLAIAREGEHAKKFSRQLKWTCRWSRPAFPIKGQDLLNQNIKPGPQITDILKELEIKWVDSDFMLSRETLLKKLV